MPIQSVFFIVLMCGAGDAQKFTKIDVLVPNWQTFRPKVQLFTQNSLPRARTTNNKNEIVAHPTDHGDTQFRPTQQPTNNPEALV
jgi:hypothetical protein